MYTYRRWAWHLESGGGNTAVYKSVNGGETWERLSGKDQRARAAEEATWTASASPWRRATRTSSTSSARRRTKASCGARDDAGETWRTVNRDPNINFRPFYYADIRVDPQNPNRVFSLSGSLYLSEDGGTTFRTIARDVHGDHQAMWIDPTQPEAHPQRIRRRLAGQLRRQPRRSRS